MEARDACRNLAEKTLKIPISKIKHEMGGKH
jgi:hypothetical protein